MRQVQTKKMVKKIKSPGLLSVHLIGIGGIGMSALARWFFSQNWTVTGSDLESSQLIGDLIKTGIRVKIGHKGANLPKNGPSMVIYSSAVPFSNPELVETRKRGIHPLSYAEVLGCLTKVYKTITVSGSHGKSTTSAMLGLVLTQNKFDPTVVLGTNLKNFGGVNFRRGHSDWLVLEADEWRASFLKYFPVIAVITNIDKEHLDYYKNYTNVKKTFLVFLKNIKNGGNLVLNQDDPGIFSIKSSILKLARKNKIKLNWYSIKTKNGKLKAEKLKTVLKVAGEHNVSNAMAALTVGKILNLKDESILKALGFYQGAWRRMEYKGRFQSSKFKVQVYDDYAHHPTEIKATLQAFKEKFPDSPIVCVYQPHQAKRLKVLFSEFVLAFKAADILILTSVYEVAGRDKVNKSFNSKKLAEAIAKKFPLVKIFYLEDLRLIKNFVEEKIQHFGYTQSPVLVMMGAGNIFNYTKLFLR